MAKHKGGVGSRVKRPAAPTKSRCPSCRREVEWVWTTDPLGRRRLHVVDRLTGGGTKSHQCGRAR